MGARHHGSLTPGLVGQLRTGMEPRCKFHPDAALEYTLSRACEPGLAEVADNRNQLAL